MGLVKPTVSLPIHWIMLACQETFIQTAKLKYGREKLESIDVLLDWMMNWRPAKSLSYLCLVYQWLSWKVISDGGRVLWQVNHLDITHSLWFDKWTAPLFAQQKLVQGRWFRVIQAVVNDCIHRNVVSAAGVVIWCMVQKSTFHVSPITLSYYSGSNEITTVNSTSLTGLAKLEKLDLSRNNLTSLSGSTFPSNTSLKLL